jgi:hypothetical protein
MDIAIARLSRAIDNAVTERRLAGATQLRDLSIAAYKCVESMDDNKRCVAYALYHFFAASDYDHDERILGGNESDKFISASSGVIRNAADFLIDGGDAGQAIEIIVAISKIEHELLPHSEH